MRNMIGVAALVTSCVAGLVGFFLGYRAGSEEGAAEAVDVAAMVLNSSKDFALLLESTLHQGRPDEEIVRKLLIEELEAFQPTHQLLANRPFYRSASDSPVTVEENEKIKEAIERLRSNHATISYVEQNKPEVGNGENGSDEERSP